MAARIAHVAFSTRPTDTVFQKKKQVSADEGGPQKPVLKIKPR
jgi:hypothetical protein